MSTYEKRHLLALILSSARLAAFVSTVSCRLCPKLILQNEPH